VGKYDDWAARAVQQVVGDSTEQHATEAVMPLPRHDDQRSIQLGSDLSQRGRGIGAATFDQLDVGAGHPDAYVLARSRLAERARWG
jgi:hypothetical protein